MFDILGINLRIEHLANFTNHFPKLAAWHMTKFGYFHPESEAGEWQKNIDVQKATGNVVGLGRTMSAIIPMLLLS